MKAKLEEVIKVDIKMKGLLAITEQFSKQIIIC